METGRREKIQKPSKSALLSPLFSIRGSGENRFFHTFLSPFFATIFPEEVRDFAHLPEAKHAGTGQVHGIVVEHDVHLMR